MSEGLFHVSLRGTECRSNLGGGHVGNDIEIASRCSQWHIYEDTKAPTRFPIADFGLRLDPFTSWLRLSAYNNPNRYQDSRSGWSFIIAPKIASKPFALSPSINSGQACRRGVHGSTSLSWAEPMGSPWTAS